MVLVNDGVINADQQNAALTLDPAFLANAGTLEATNDATLVFSNTTVSNSSATTEAPGNYSFNDPIDDPAAPTAPERHLYRRCRHQRCRPGRRLLFVQRNRTAFSTTQRLRPDSRSAGEHPGAAALAPSPSTIPVKPSAPTFRWAQYSSVSLQQRHLRASNDPAGVKGTLANGINNTGQIVGEYIDARGSPHGFLFSAGPTQHLTIPWVSTASTPKASTIPAKSSATTWTRPRSPTALSITTAPTPRSTILGREGHFC